MHDRWEICVFKRSILRYLLDLSVKILFHNHYFKVIITSLTLVNTFMIPSGSLTISADFFSFFFLADAITILWMRTVHFWIIVSSMPAWKSRRFTFSLMIYNLMSYFCLSSRGNVRSSRNRSISLTSHGISASLVNIFRRILPQAPIICRERKF